MEIIVAIIQLKEGKGERRKDRHADVGPRV